MERPDPNRTYSRADRERARRSTPERRRKTRLLYGGAVAFLWTVDMPFDYWQRGDDTLVETLINLALPSPFAGIWIAYFLWGSAMAKRSKLTDEEARQLGDEIEAQVRQATGNLKRPFRRRP